MAASANLNPGQVSMFEPVHGSAPKYAGTGKANLIGAILTLGLLLAELGHGAAAAAIDQAVAAAFASGEVTADLGGKLTTSELGDQLAAAVRGSKDRAMATSPSRMLSSGRTSRS